MQGLMAARVPWSAVEAWPPAGEAWAGVAGSALACGCWHEDNVRPGPSLLPGYKKVRKLSDRCNSQTTYRRLAISGKVLTYFKKNKLWQHS